MPQLTRNQIDQIKQLVEGDTASGVASRLCCSHSFVSKIAHKGGTEIRHPAFERVVDKLAEIEQKNSSAAPKLNGGGHLSSAGSRRAHGHPGSRVDAHRTFGAPDSAEPFQGRTRGLRLA